MNNQSLIGDMKSIFQWVAMKRKKKFHIYNEYQSTKTCSNSSVVMESIKLDERVWKCECGCGGIHLRDHNSAVNGLAKTYCDLGSNLSIVP
ncbi:MAG: zinc ribbon domain-containing protein, partial [Bdellovibrionia bacterium]